MMADVAGLVLAVGQILSALYEYGQTTSHARQDIKDLSTELLVLQGILRQVEKRDLTKSSIIAIGQHSDPQNVLKSTERSLETLLRNLKVPASGFKKVVNYAKWPLDKKDVVDQLSRFERLKSLLILTFLTEASEEISNAVQSLKISMEQDLNRIDDFLSWQKDSQLIRWLAPLSPEERHLRFCNEREPETRKWFLDGPFDTWVSGPDQGVMCLTGKSGTGKTTLFSFAVDKLSQKCQAQSMWISAFWYCSFTETASQQPTHALGSFLCQFAQHDATFLADAREVYEQGKYSSFMRPMELAQIEDSLCKHLQGYERVFLLVDAVNESQQNEELLKSLFRLMRKCKGLRLLISTIGEAPCDYEGAYLTTVVRFQPKGSQADIAAMVENALASRSGLRDLSAKLKQDIREAFLHQADGSFRWAYLSLENLAQQNTPRQIRQALKSLPTTLEDSYTEILLQIPEKDKSLAQAAILWLTFARRPLTLVELNEAIIVEDGETDIDEEDRICRKEAILETCRGLVDCYAGVVSLAHSSVETFLTASKIKSTQAARFSLEPGKGDKILMQKCLQYLSMDIFRSGPCRDVQEFKARLKTYPLLEYAAQHWPLHAKRCELDKSDVASIMDFFHTWRLPNGGNHASWVQVLIPDIDPWEHEIWTENQPLYYAASFGLYEVVKALLQEDSGADLFALGGRYGSTPLFVALWREQYDVALLLLDAGSDATLEDEGSGLTAMELMDPVTKADPSGPLATKVRQLLIDKRCSS